MFYVFRFEFTVSFFVVLRTFLFVFAAHVIAPLEFNFVFEDSISGLREIIHSNNFYDRDEDVKLNINGKNNKKELTK